MQNISVMSLGNQVAAKLVARANAGSAKDSGQDFQAFMNHAGQAGSPAKQAVPAETRPARAAQMPDASSQADAAVSGSAEQAANAQKPVLTEKQLADVEKAVEDVVRDTLDMDEDTFEAVMAQMGITPVQLLEPAVLQEFILLANKGNDVTDLLTSEAMFGAFADVMQALETVDWEGLAGVDADGQVPADMLQMLEAAVNESAAGAENQEAGVMGNLPGGEGEDVVFLHSSEEAFVEEAAGVLEEAADGTMDAGIPEAVSNQLTPSEAGTAEQPDRSVLQDMRTPEEEQVAAVAQDVSDRTVAVKNQAELPQSETGEQTGHVETDVVSVNMSVADASGEGMAEEMPRQQTQSQLSYQGSGQVLPETQPQAMTFVDFVENMMQAVPEEQMPEQVNMQQMIDIVNQVVEQIHSSMEDSATTLEMQLNPESLGKLLLTVTNKNSVMTASFTVQTTEAKVALESQMATLRDNLEQKNLKVEAVEVSVSDFAFSQSGGADTGDQKEFSRGNGRRSRFEYDEGDEEETADAKAEAEQVRRSVMRDSGSSIDYTA